MPSCRTRHYLGRRSSTWWTRCPCWCFWSSRRHPATDFNSMTTNHPHNWAKRNLNNVNFVHPEIVRRRRKSPTKVFQHQHSNYFWNIQKWVQETTSCRTYQHTDCVNASVVSCSEFKTEIFLGKVIERFFFVWPSWCGDPCQWRWMSSGRRWSLSHRTPRGCSPCGRRELRPRSCRRCSSSWCLKIRTN